MGQNSLLQDIKQGSHRSIRVPKIWCKSTELSLRLPLTEYVMSVMVQDYQVERIHHLVTEGFREMK